MSLRNTFIILLLLFSLNTIAQGTQKAPYSYPDLSSFYYKKLKDSLIKFYPCPKLYIQKNTQKKYNDLWNDRLDMIKTRIENNQYFHSSNIQNYLDCILQQIYNGNKNLFPEKPSLFVDRISNINAYSCGLNLVFINIGVMCYVKSREELAFIIAHELSHNLLKHADQSMKENSEWLTSSEYQNSLELIRKEKYEKLTKLINIHKTFAFSSNKHSRYSENNADSMAVVLLKNSGIPFSANWLLHLDSTDIIYKNNLKNNLADYFTPYGININSSLTQQRTRGLSTKKHNFKDTTGIADSLKTHPDCKVRYEKTLTYNTSNAVLTSLPNDLDNQSNKILLWNLYDDKHLASCLYRILSEKDKGNTDPWYDFMLYNVFYGLEYSCKHLDRFNAIGVLSKEYISSSYYELQNLLEQMPEEEISGFCTKLANAGFWSQLTPDAVELKKLMVNMIDASLTAKEKSKLAKEYIDIYPNSWYNEFAKHFIIK